MKKTLKFVGVIAVTVGIGLLASTTTLAFSGRGGPSGGFGFGHGGGFRDGFHNGFHHNNRWGGWYPWAFSFSYYGATYYPYYYYPPSYYYYSPYYYSPPVYYSPSVVYSSPSPAPVIRSSPAPVPRNYQGQPLSVADIKALAKAELSDEVILSQIRNSKAVYHLTAAEIIDLKNSGASEKVIDFMINTASAPSPHS